VNRREFIAGLAGAAAGGLDARAQSPVRIGFVDNGPAEARHDALQALRRGLSDTGYVEGQNLIIDYVWATDEEEFPRLAAELVTRRVGAIVAPGLPQALALKVATRTIPVIFTSAVDPIEAGLVTSLNRPEDNLTGFSGLISLVASKRLEILRRLLPEAKTIAHLADSKNEALTQPETRELQRAARALGVQLLILGAHEPNDFESAFVDLTRQGASALLISGSKIFTAYASSLAALASRYRVPTSYGRREGAVAGGLMSYGTDFPEMYRQTGVYTGRILRGERPSSLPVQQVTKMQFVVNLKTARGLGLTVPETLLATADEVIE
jgi:putative ABC transport system substrate-binding protein